MGFWKNFWNNIKKLADDPESDKQVRTRVQKWEDVNHFNPLDVVVSKLNTMVNDEATFDIISDSVLAEPLRELCKELEDNRYEICGLMLGKGGCFVTLATDSVGNMYHRILSPDDVSVYETDGDKLIELALVIDRKTVRHQTHYLVRHHFLDKNGTLYIYYYTTNQSGNKEYFEDWKDFENDGVAFTNANNIGVGYFKSPKDSRGLSRIFGVPLNFGCEEVENEIISDRKALADEMKNAEMLLFADESIVRIENETKNWIGAEIRPRRYRLPEKLFTIRKKAGVDGTLIDSFAPSTRYDDYEKKLNRAYMEYEDAIGLNRGFLTESETTSNATATEIRTANVKTISMIKRVQAAMYEGVKSVLDSDCVYLNIDNSLYALSVDWYDIFTDEAVQWQRLKDGADYGVVEKSDIVRWLFPNLTSEEISEKIARISNSQIENTNRTIDSILQGQ